MRLWIGFVAFVGWALCKSGLHVPPANTNVGWVPFFYCVRCGERIDGGRSAHARRQRRERERAQRRGK